MKYYPVTNLQVRLHLLENKCEGKKSIHATILFFCNVFVLCK